MKGSVWWEKRGRLDFGAKKKNTASPPHALLSPRHQRGRHTLYLTFLGSVRFSIVLLNLVRLYDLGACIV